MEPIFFMGAPLRHRTNLYKATWGLRQLLYSFPRGKGGALSAPPPKKKTHTLMSVSQTLHLKGLSLEVCKGAKCFLELRHFDIRFQTPV